ncbi:hypothetical protein BDQ17DRAFT_1352945 [Cyathus striatus]|nr:hypothetical protein BDQ17DRAFT_1352945 [Cyathus striatus]
MRLLRATGALLRSPPSSLSPPRFYSTKSESDRNSGSSMIWSASVLSSVTSDTEPTVVINFDNAKYIFNTGENTNRAFLQSRLSWKRCRGIFFTQNDAKRSSGLTGLMMSLADASSRRLDIVGPPGVTHLVAASRLYTFRDSMTVNPIEIDCSSSTNPEPEPIYKDDNVMVYAIPINPSLRSGKTNSDTSMNTDAADVSLDASLKRKRDPSPDQPQKRRLVEPDVSLEALMRNSEFTPETLEGKHAEDWRKRMVSVMFPSTNIKPFNPPTEKKGKKGQKKNAKGGNVDPSALTPTPTSTCKLTNDKGGQLDSASLLPIDKSGQPDDYRRARASLPTGYHKQLPKFTWDEGPFGPRTTFAYVIFGPRIRGKFNVPKAVELDKEGDKVVGEREVKPEECMEPNEPPAVVIVLDVPTLDHIPSVVSSFTEHPFFRHCTSSQPEDIADCNVRTVFHLCGKGVLEDERYIKFINSFNDNVHHMISSKEHTPDYLTFTSSGYSQLRLNKLDSEMFPKPAYSLTANRNISDIIGLPSNCHLMEANMIVKVRPAGQPQVDPTGTEADRFHPIVRGDQSLTLSEGALQRFEVARANVERDINANKWPVKKGANVGILPLGTGSALATKYRNEESLFYSHSNTDWGNILLDAGEGTWGQLTRHFGMEDTYSPNVWQVLRDLKCIFVSHIHADHHLGLAKLLAMRRTLDPPPPDPLYLVTIRAVHLYLREMSDVMDLGIDDRSRRGVIPIMTEALHWRKPEAYNTGGMWQVGGTEPSRHHAAEMCAILGLVNFGTVDVYHKTRAYGAIITHDDGWRIVFSGDTMPTENLVHAGRGATVLIHEATMCDDQEEMAKRKAHSTFGQAVGIGRRMGAENILLTHFSARYPKLPPSMVNSVGDIESFREGPILALAYDHARLTIGNMWKLGYYLPALEKTVEDTAEEQGDAEELAAAADLVPNSIDMA